MGKKRLALAFCPALHGLQLELQSWNIHSSKYEDLSSMLLDSCDSKELHFGQSSLHETPNSPSVIVTNSIPDRKALLYHPMIHVPGIEHYGGAFAPHLECHRFEYRHDDDDDDAAGSHASYKYDEDCRMHVEPSDLDALILEEHDVVVVVTDRLAEGLYPLVMSDSLRRAVDVLMNQIRMPQDLAEGMTISILENEGSGGDVMVPLHSQMSCYHPRCSDSPPLLMQGSILRFYPNHASSHASISITLSKLEVQTCFTLNNHSTDPIDIVLKDFGTMKLDILPGRCNAPRTATHLWNPMTSRLEGTSRTLGHIIVRDFVARDASWTLTPLHLIGVSLVIALMLQIFEWQEFVEETETKKKL